MSSATPALPQTGRVLQAALREHFGFRQFRPGQRQAAAAAFEGRDAIVVMPTGSGKSLCFQLPALALPGTTVVISPLIALMKDQVDSLRARGKRAAALHSGLSTAERAEALELLDAGHLEFLYATPERLADPDFRERLVARGPIDLIVVDEAHCLSQWGHDFRPDYLTVGAAIDHLGRPPVLALTATATDDVIRDIGRLLGIPDAEVVHTGFYRENLALGTAPVADETQRRTRLLAGLDAHEGQGLIYTATVKAVEELTDWLTERGIDAAGYHGRMASRRRTQAQERFMAGSVRVMVATNAFGLGIDKPDIRFVIHHHLPPTLEAYYQEFGRAGRDGAPASALLLHHPDDARLYRFFQARRYPDTNDLVNVHHALRRLATGADAEAPDLDALRVIAPIPPVRLRLVLNLLVAQGVVSQDRRGRFELLKPDLDREALGRLTSSSRERDESDRLKLQQVLDYAVTRRCRWQALLSAFGHGDEADPLTCGRCDNCLRQNPAD